MKNNRFFRTAVTALLCVCMLIALPMQAFADESSVSYEQGAHKFVFLDDDELFNHFRGLMPGDTVSQEITVKNAASSKCDVEIFMRVEAVDKKYEDFLSKLNLNVEWKGNDKFFQAPASSQGNLAKDVSLGVFTPGASGKLVATVEIPFDLSNDYQNDYGEVVWIFTAVEKEIIVKPGDTALVVPAACLLGVSAIAMVTLLVLKKKKNEKEDTLGKAE